jgi:hypothetical protein
VDGLMRRAGRGCPAEQRGMGGVMRCRKQRGLARETGAARTRARCARGKLLELEGTALLPPDAARKLCRCPDGADEREA